MTSRQFAVIGSPISHSLSPTVHLAAYRALGLNWLYRAIDVLPGEMASFFSRHLEINGVSVTMPLKSDIARLAARRDFWTERLGVGNTALRSEKGDLTVYNTDVAGIREAVARAGDSVGYFGEIHTRRAAIVGTGATARSAVAACWELGYRELVILARRPEAAAELIDLTRALDIAAAYRNLADLAVRERAGQLGEVEFDLLICTLPATAGEWAKPLAGLATLSLDVSYSPWPSALARWSAEYQAPVISGVEMLFWQAVHQVRLFVNGSVDVPLADEESVRTKMRQALSAAMSR